MTRMTTMQHEWSCRKHLVTVSTEE